MIAYVRSVRHHRKVTAELPDDRVSSSFNLHGASARITRERATIVRPSISQSCTRRQPVTCSAGIAYRCPTCSQPLREAGKATLTCDTGHTILRAKEGHVHLRPSGRKAAVNAAGDSPEMVKARRKFFDAGYYNLVADQIGSIITDAYTSCNEVSILDAGCGEGMYLARVQAALQGAGKECEAFGVDVSKTAIRMAAKRHRQASFAVASSYVLPFYDQAFDGVISVFAPVAAQEFARVLRRPGGILVVGCPGEQHLIELKSLLYKQPKLFSEDSVPVAELLSAGLQQGQTVRVKRDLTLTQSDAVNLLGMTPFFWHAPPDILEQLAMEDGFRTRIDILLTVFRRA